MNTTTPRQRGKRIATPATDHDGAAIVRVPLANTTATAKVLVEDFARLTSRGITSQWTFNPAKPGVAYVRCGHADATGRLIIVARAIMEPPPGHVVRYRDGDRTNLRRDNLHLESGRAGARETAIMEDAPAEAPITPAPARVTEDRPAAP